MPNPWFRLYSEIRQDPKVRTMPEAYQLRLIWLFTLRCEGPTEELSREELMYGLSCDETLLETLRGVFHAKGFIEENWAISHWGSRQYVSDSSTDRVRKFREKQALKQDETLQKRRETQNVTDQNRTEQIQNIKTSLPTPRKKRVSEDGMKHSSDPRHLACKEAVFEYYRSKNAGENPPWNGQEGKALGMLLGSDPHLDGARMKTLLRNRYKSQVNHAERPGRWLGYVHNYAAGPLDQFGKPIAHVNGQQKPQILKMPLNGPGSVA